MSTTAETMTVVAADGSLGFHWHRFTIETLPDREHWFLDLQLPRRKHAEIRFLYETRSWGAPDESGYESDRYLFFYASAASLWIIVCVTWIYPAVRLYRNIISRWRQRSGHCRTCGYDLTGNVSGRCPECGEHIEAVK